MIRRKVWIIAFVWLALMVGAGAWAIISLQEVSRPWPPMRAAQLILQSPAGFALALLAYPWFAFLYPGRRVPPSHVPWLEVALAFMGILFAGGEAFAIAWAKSWVGLNSLGAVTPIAIGASGLSYVVLGNWAPKLVSPFKGLGPEPYDWTRLNRLTGWAMAISGLAMLACAFALSGALALQTCLVLAIAPLPVWLVGWMFRFGDRPPSAHLPGE
jgi:hypothetical protein